LVLLSPSFKSPSVDKILSITLLLSVPFVTSPKDGKDPRDGNEEREELGLWLNVSRFSASLANSSKFAMESFAKSPNDITPSA
jgi:hypothetical protein